MVVSGTDRWLAEGKHPNEPEMWVSHETIYLSLFVQSRGALRHELTRILRTHRAMRHPRAKRDPTGKGRIRRPVMISERPAEAADRAVPGALGISMLLSSGFSEWWWVRGPGALVAYECPEDIDAASGESDDGLGVGAALVAFLDVEVAVRSGSHHAGLS